MTKVFISAPFFSKSQIYKVKQVEKALADNPTVDEYYSPRLHQNGDGYKPFSKSWCEATFKHDLNGVKWCDATIDILDFDNGDSDSGTSWEMGAGYLLGKFTTTISFDNHPTNLMLGVSSRFHFSNVAQLRHYNFNKRETNEFPHRMH